MSVVSAIVGIVIVAACFGLMVWGQNYLGEDAARSPRDTKDNDTKGAIDTPCRNCGKCTSQRITEDKD